MAYKVIILYRLYMPSYVLGTFTEYPFFCCIKKIIPVIKYGGDKSYKYSYLILSTASCGSNTCRQYQTPSSLRYQPETYGSWYAHRYMG